MKMKWMLLMLLTLAACLPAEVLIFDNLDGNISTPLNGLKPDIGNSAWIAHSSWTAAGTHTTNDCSATLPFTPQAGRVYQLTVRFIDVATAGDWGALGFTAGSSTSAGDNAYRFIGGVTAGQPWMLHRAAADTRADQAFYGPGTTGGADITGTYTGDADMRIILDTTQAQWGVIWQVKKVTSDDFTTGRTYTYTTNPNIGAVGAARSKNVYKMDYILLDVSDGGSATPSYPKFAQIEVPLNATLSWTGATAEGVTGYKLYVAVDEPNFIDVAPVVIDATGDQTGVTPPLALEMDKTYFWRIDGIAEPNAVEGPISFFDTIKSVPTFDSDPVSQFIDAGETAVFDAHFTSRSLPTVKWYLEAGETDTLIGTVDTSISPVKVGDYTLTIDTNGTENGFITGLSIANADIADQGYYYCIASTTESDQSQPASLVIKRMLAYYPLDTNADDAVGSNHGTPKAEPDPNIPPGFGPGIVGDGALILDGTQYVELSTDAYPKPGLGNGVTSGTVSCWARVDGLAPDQTNVMFISTHNSNGVTAIQLWVDGSPEDINFRIRHATGDATFATGVSTTPVIADGQFHLFTVTYQEGGLTQIYLDGLPVGNAANFGIGQTFAAWDYPVLIGANNNRGVPNGHLVGAIDDMKIYNYPLTAYQVADLYLEVYPDAELCILDYANSYDFNNDCRVDLLDFAQITEVWLSCGVYMDPACD